MLDLLSNGDLEVAGRLVDASNLTMYCKICGDSGEVACVYKPVAGERPLWDFPEGSLAGREVSAYEVSRAAGWNVVPPTVYRDGPLGPGMCQLWIDTDDTVDLVALARRSDHARLRQMAVFDAVVNNADRKIGHLLPAPTGGCSAATMACASAPSTSCGPSCGSGAASGCRVTRSRPWSTWTPCWAGTVT